MSYWKVIFATLVIFCSGLVVGALLVKKTARAVVSSRVRNISTNTPLSLWHQQQQKEFLRRMDHELELNPEQRANIEKILKDSQDRIKQIREKIGPELRDELKNVREQIHGELTAEQQKKFERVVKIRPPRKSDDGKKDGARHSRTNAPSTRATTPANP